MVRKNLKRMNSGSSKADTSQGIGGAPFRPSKAALRGATIDTVPVYDDKVHCYILQYCSSMEVYGAPCLAEAGVSVRMVCNSRPSPLYDLKKAMTRYCELLCASQEWPANFDGVEEL